VRKIPVLRTVALLTHHLVDIKGDNILQEIEDKSILEAFTKAEMEHPSPRKFVKDAPVYASRRFERPKTFGRAVLSDFGSAVCGDPKRNHDAQPNVYRSPEVMLKTEWSYPIDIWNVGVMVRPVYFSGHHASQNSPNRCKLGLGFV
jgi:serine/threonine-protein kinase SRPK3